MTIQQFLDKYLGQFIDFDGYYGAQCVDLIQQYNKEVFGGGFIPGQGAADIWETYPTEIYNRVLNTIDALPQLGDIMIWKKTTSLPFGHIAIVKNASQTKFTSLDQNWPTGGKCQYIEHNYENPQVIGWLHPKTLPVIIGVNEWEQKLKIYNSVFYKPEDVIKFIDDRKTEINTLNQAITDKDVTINNLNGQISNLEKEKNILADELRVCQSNNQSTSELNDKLILVTQELNQLKLNYEKAKGDWGLKEVGYNKQIALLTTKYNATKSSLKKLFIDYIFGKK